MKFVNYQQHASICYPILVEHRYYNCQLEAHKNHRHSFPYSPLQQIKFLNLTPYITLYAIFELIVC